MDGIKQRIIGAIVLVSLAVIFLPMIFDKPYDSRETQIITIPDEPDIPKFTIEQPKIVTLRESNAGEPNPRAPLDDIDSTQQIASLQESAEAPNQKVSKETDPKNVVSGRNLDSASKATNSRATEKASSSAEESKEKVKPVEKVVQKKEEKQKQEKQNKITSEQQVALKNKSNPQPKDFTLDKSGAPTAWVIQIGTFKNRAGAQKIRDQVRSIKKKAFTQDFEANPGVLLTRVFAGPFLTKSEAEKLKPTLDKRFKVDSLVKQYKP